MSTLSTPEATKAAAQTHDAPARPVARGASGSSGGRGIAYTLGPGVTRPATITPYERQSADPVYRPLQVYTLDHAALALEGATTVLRVPYEPLAPGPRGSVFQVDATDDDGTAAAPINLEEPRLLLTQGRSPSPSDPQFRQQMVYAVCSSVHAAFRAALGRRIAWGFDRPDPIDGGNRLTLRPTVRQMGANAAYRRDRGDIAFGHFVVNEGIPKGRLVPGGVMYTCLSHDIVVHEVTHALIDGMRSHFLHPTSADVLGFHEGFADLIAILQHFSYPQVLESEIRKSGNELDRAPLLLGIAQAFGLSLGKRGTLRSTWEAPDRKYHPRLEAHAMGSVLVSAMLDAFCVVYKRKTERFVALARRRSGAPAELSCGLIAILASEASKLASQVLSMCVRALDYCPPVDVRLGEFLRALITADRELVPDDPWAYREAIIDAFAGRGIYPEHVEQLSEDALLWRSVEGEMVISPLSFAELKFAGDPASPAGPTELERQACALGEFVTRPDRLGLFGLVAPWDERLAGSRAELPCVQSVRTCRRVGPDGQILFDLVAEVTQSRFVRDPQTGTECEFTGGATVILDPRGVCRYVIEKSVMSCERLAQQLDYQRTSDLWEEHGGRRTLAPDVLRLIHRARGEPSPAART